MCVYYKLQMRLIEQLHPVILNVGFAVHNADWNWKDVNSPFMRVYLVTKGTAKVVLPSEILQLTPGNLYFISAFTKHSYICDSHFCHYYLHLYEESDLNDGLLDEWTIPHEISATELDLLLFQRLCCVNPQMSLLKSDPATYDNNPTLKQNLLRNKQRALCDKVESHGIVLQLLSHFLKVAIPNRQSKDLRIKTALEYIKSHICEVIKLEQLTMQACLSKDHFIRLFKEETGETPLQFIIRRKIEKAQILLLAENRPIKEIAISLAFEDYSYFNRVFKKITGVTPCYYRNLHLLSSKNNNDIAF